MERATVHVNGVVQSVGFRPFVYRTATDLDLRGTVRNRGDAGVHVELEGPPESIDAFLDALREDPPPLARVETVRVEREPVDDSSFESFAIVESGGGEGGGGTIPPDTAICDACLADVRDPDSRFHGYWATACVDCGPRFTVVEGLPYDRPRTSMAAFPPCEDCRAEYENPADRRYHAQAIACPDCGPTLRYLPDAPDSQTDTPDEGRDPFPGDAADATDGRAAVRAAAETVRDGGTVVVKGIGGAHLACDATDPGAVARLRERTERPEKPFAVMAPDLDAVASFADPSPAERDELTAPRRPIVLLPTTDEGDLAPAVAPSLHTVGTMLPYSGVHHLLFDHLDGPVVLTSANRPGRPMHTANADIVAALGDVADGVLLHDRRIVARCDDSVARIVDRRRRLVRRSRGFVPTPLPLPEAGRVLALGPELDVTAAVLADEDCYCTQHVGDVDDPGTFAFLADAIDHLLSVTGLERPPVVAHDAHPEFRTTEHARDLVTDGRAAERVAVQHHHAHAASVLAEHDRERAVALTLDGLGYGPDGTVWGGEVLDASRADYERVGGLAPMDMPGGDRATRHPGRMLAGALHRHAPDRAVAVLADHDVPLPGGDEERDLLAQQLEAGVNTLTTTSAGRYLDAASALLGACTERTYEGEPAMKLEALAARGEPRSLAPPRDTVDGRPVLDAPALLARLVDLHADGTRPADVAATAQAALAEGLATIAVAAATERGREAVALTGGVAYNEHVSRRVREVVTAADLAFLGNERIPPGDGGIAYGQAAVAAAQNSESSR